MLAVRLIWKPHSGKPEVAGEGAMQMRKIDQLPTASLMKLRRETWEKG